MNESSRLSDVFFDWATVLDMALVSCTVVRNFIQRWELLDLPSAIEDGSCVVEVTGAAVNAAGPADDRSVLLLLTVGFLLIITSQTP